VHVVIVTSLMLSLASTAPPTPPADPCAGELDAVVEPGRLCRSPVALTSAVAADAVIVEAPARDPQLLPGEIGFFAVVSAVVGGGVIASTFLTPAVVDGTTDATLRQATLWTGVGFVSLAGLLGAAALGTWVFNPATGTMQLPIFDGEPR